MNDISAENIVPAGEATAAHELVFNCEILRSADDLAKFAPSIARLSSRALEPNVLYEAPVLEATWRHLLSASRQQEIVLYSLPAISGQPGELVGLFPLVHSPFQWAGIPIANSFSNLMSFSGTPLVDGRYAEDVIARFLRDQKDRSGIPGGVRFTQVPVQGSFYQAFSRALQHAGWSAKLFDAHQRISLDATKPGEETLDASMKKSKRKDVARYMRRLDETGELRFEVVTHRDHIALALQDFLTLEDSGWKGQNKTSIASNPKWAAYFNEVVTGLAQSGHCAIIKLTLDEELLAAAIVPMVGNTAWFYKTAFNETYARYSPGILLTVELTRYLCDHPEITFADACTHLEDGIWREQMAVADVFAVPFNGPARFFPFAMEKARRSLRACLKSAKYCLGLQNLRWPRPQKEKQPASQLDAAPNDVSAQNIVPINTVATIDEADFSCEVLRNVDDLKKIAPYITKLSARALEPNVLMQPSMLEATWRHLTSKYDHPEIVLCWAPVVPGRPQELVGLFPLIRNATTHWAGIPIANGFSNLMSFQSTPLVDARCAEKVIARFLHSQKSSSVIPHGLRFKHIPTQGGFYEAFISAAERTGWTTRDFDIHERAALDAERPGEETVNTSLKKSKRQQLARYMRRLSEKGEVRFEVVKEKDQIIPAMHDFLTLENSGWKRAAKTSIRSNPDWLAYFEDGIAGLAANGECEIIKLTLGDELIAAGIIPISGNTAWFYKVSFNENYASYSPGVLLTVELTRYLCDRPGITFADSCGVQSNPLMNHIWRERMEVVDLFAVPMAGRLSETAFAIEKARRAMRAGLKSAKGIITHRLAALKKLKKFLPI